MTKDAHVVARVYSRGEIPHMTIIRACTLALVLGLTFQLK